MDDAAKILAMLATDNPVDLDNACQIIVASHARRPGVTQRLIEILADERDWDFGNYPAVSALAALVRIDPSGRMWLMAAGEAAREHAARHNTDLCSAMVRVVRQAVQVKDFLAWANQYLPEPSDPNEPWIVTVLAWCGTLWHDDRRFVDGLLTELDDVSRLYVLGELVSYETVTQWLLQRDPQPIYAEQLERLARWTRLAPQSVREAAQMRMQRHLDGETPGT